MIDPQAQEVHGITKEMLSNKKYMIDHADRLGRIFKDQILMGYNVQFDIDRINASGALYLYEAGKLDELLANDQTFALMHEQGLSVPYKSSVDLMPVFSVHNAEWHETKECWKRKKLSFALSSFNIQAYFQCGKWHDLNQLHDSLADTQATIELFFNLVSHADPKAWGDVPVENLFSMSKAQFDGAVARIRLN